MKLTKAEQETIILFNEAEQTASVYTHNAALLHQLERLCCSHPAQVRQTERGRHSGATYLLPKKWVKLRAPVKMSEERRAIMVESGKRLAAIAKAKLEERKAAATQED